MDTRLCVKFYLHILLIAMHIPILCHNPCIAKTVDTCNDIFAEDIARIKENNFLKSMQKSSRFHQKIADKNPVWQNIMHRFHTFQNNIHVSEEPRIPKIIHHIWLGSRLPKKDVEYMQTWREQHPTWLHFLWTDRAINSDLGDYFIRMDEIPDIIDKKKTYSGARIVIYVRPDDIYNKEAYLHGSNFAQTSNILRYEILYNFGGMYVDTDFVCLHPFDVFHHTLSCYAGLGFISRLSIMNGLIGTAPQHPIMAWCVKHVNHYTSNFQDKQSTQQTLQGTGVRFFKDAFFHTKDDAPDMVLFPFTFFSPWPAHERHKRKNPETWIRPESYALHMWHGAWRTAGRPPRPENI